LISNVDDSLEPTFQNKYTKSIVITKYGRPIGIVGVTTTFPSNWGNVKILPEVEAVRNEVAKLKSDGVNIIIVLSHCGLEVDREIAKHAGPIAIIVGGHSHSFLYSGENPPGPDRPVDSYPTIEKSVDDGHDVLIVQASAYTKYLGDITLYFDDDGKVQNYEGAPIFLGHDVVPDAETLRELAPWKQTILELQNRVVGFSKFDISSNRCYSKECGMGNLFTDAFIHGVRRNYFF
jgi:5'-nucleotidase